MLGRLVVALLGQLLGGTQCIGGISAVFFSSVGSDQ
jgi:hypothetical protein